ncbi:TMEM175 family protein [Leucobacter sp. HY1910]
MAARSMFQRDRSEFDRGLGFFDAIYGFAVTLLIANVDLPPAEFWANPVHLLSSGLGTQLTGFAISFVVIAVFWYSNTELLGKFRGIDGPIIAANLVTACLIVVLPFTTQGISDPSTAELPLATAIYAVNVALAMVSQSVMFELGRARGLIGEDVPRAAWWAGRLDLAARVTVFAVSIPVAYAAGPTWGQLSWLLLVPVGVMMGGWSAKVAARAA